MADYICSACGYEGNARRRKRGSAALEWALWLTILFPGPPYSIWRRVGVSKECPHCHKETIVRLNSGEGWAIKKRMDRELGLVAQSTDQSSGNAGRQVEEINTKKPVNPDQW
jgi:hypothetical protein